MNKLFISAAVGATCFGIAAAAAQEMTLEGAKVLLTEVPGAMDCTPPGTAPDVPDGASATAAEMNGTIEQYNSWGKRIEDYQNCIDEAARDAGGGLTEEQDQAVTMVYDSFVDEQQAFADAFNEQVKLHDQFAD